jgi:hypothetical protein
MIASCTADTPGSLRSSRRCCTTLTVVQAQPRGPAREIIPLTGDLYRARNGNWYTIFLVTRDGIILGDPDQSGVRDLAEGELGHRFKVPVRYVVYSHSHFDHARAAPSSPTPPRSSRTRTCCGTWTAAIRTCRAT